ncbi:MAG: phosphatidate cytidylyltransferase [Firmicutes bacterium]|nr:phosphatidate cytidylyltransferase [Bacillota bacterium]
MRTRALTGSIIIAVYIAVLMLTVFVSRYFFDAFVLLLMLTAGYEMTKVLTKNDMKPLFIFIILNVIVGYVLFYVLNYVAGLQGGVSIFFVSVLINILAVVIYTNFSKKKDKSSLVGTIFVLIYPQAALIYMLGLSHIGVFGDYRFYIAAILLLFLVSTLSDTFAYLVGSTFKGPKLVPQISPKKTVSGFFGGILGGLIAGAIVMLFSLFNILETPLLSQTTGFNIMHFLVLGGIGSLCTQLGDLIASYIKRKFEIKDFSSLLPGHGGVLDRIDGMMINGVFIYVYFMILLF